MVNKLNFILDFFCRVIVCEEKVTHAQLEKNFLFDYLSYALCSR